MNSKLNKPLFYLPPATRHIIVFLLGFMAIMTIFTLTGHPPWSGFPDCMMALGFVLIGLTLAIGKVARGGSKILLIVECLWLAFPLYLCIYALNYFANFLASGRR